MLSCDGRACSYVGGVEFSSDVMVKYSSDGGVESSHSEWS